MIALQGWPNRPVSCPGSSCRLRAVLTTTDDCSIHVEHAAVLGSLLGRLFLLLLLCFLLGGLLLLLLHGFGLRFLEDLVSKFGQLLVLFLHVGAKQDGLLMLGKGGLLALQFLKPLGDAVALLDHLPQLVWRDVAVLVTRVLRSCLVV